MFKIFVKLMLFLLVLAVAGPFILRDKYGAPLMTLSDLKLPHFDFRLPGANEGQPSPSETASNQQWIQWSDRIQSTISPDRLSREQLAQLDIKAQPNIYYRWQDVNGVWQFSNLPNRNTLNFVVRTDPDANVLQSLSQEQVDKVFGRGAANENNITQGNPMANGKGLENSLPIPTTIPVTEIPKLLEQAKEVQKIADARLKQMENVGK